MNTNWRKLLYLLRSQQTVLISRMLGPLRCRPGSVGELPGPVRIPGLVLPRTVKSVRCETLTFRIKTHVST